MLDAGGDAEDDSNVRRTKARTRVSATKTLAETPQLSGSD